MGWAASSLRSSEPRRSTCSSNSSQGCPDMKFSNFVRMHWAAFRALLVLTVITGFAYPLRIWLVAQLPGLHDKAEGSIITASGKPVGRGLFGSLFNDKE